MLNQKLHILNEFVSAQADEYRRRLQLYGAAAKNLDDFSAGADSLTSPLDLHVRIVAIAEVGKAILSLLDENGKKSLTLLDSGCGIGTQSLAFAALGYDVTAIDLNEELISLARARVDFYAKRLARSIACQFFAKNILKEPMRDRYDVIWAREAISHIHPLEDFLSQAHDALKENGILVISDANWSNPLVKLELFKSYWKYYRPFRTWGEASIYYITERQDPETGQTISMAMERVLNLPKTVRKLREAGFKDVSGRTIGILPKSTVAKVLTKNETQRIEIFDRLNGYENNLLKVPWLRNLGQINVVVGRRI